MEHKILILRVSNDVTYSNNHDSVKSLQALNIHQDTSAVNVFSAGMKLIQFVSR